MNLVAVVPKGLSSSDVLTTGYSKFTKFGALVPTALLVKYIWQRKWMLAMRLLVNYRPSTLLKNGCRIPVIGQISINGSFELLGISDGAWGCEFLFIDNVQSPTMLSGWGDADTSNQNWGVTPGDLTETSQLPEVVPSLPIQIKWPGFRRAHVLMRGASVMISVVCGVTSLSVYALEVATLSSILGSIIIVMNNFCYKYLLLVSVTFLFILSLV